MSLNIAQIVVSYNNVDYLNQLFEKINEQNNDIINLFVIDNSNEVKKKEIKRFCNNYSESKTNFKVNYFPTINNIGSAAAFSLGMYLTYKDYDWLWLHDHDGFPLKNCLNILLNFVKKNEEPCIISPVVKDLNKGCVINGFQIRMDSWGRREFVVPVNDIEEIDAAGTAGLMVHSEIIKNIGFYDYKNYFVGKEDYDFCFRAKKNGHKIYLLKEAVYHHPDKWLDYKNANKRFFINLGYFRKNMTFLEKTITKGDIYFWIKYTNWVYRFVNIIFSFFKIFLLKILKSNYDVILLESYKYYFACFNNDIFSFILKKDNKQLEGFINKKFN